MDDTQIVDLYFARSETAIKETDNKYGGYCYKIAYSILANREDSEESVSDTGAVGRPVKMGEPLRRRKQCRF